MHPHTRKLKRLRREQGGRLKPLARTLISTAKLGAIVLGTPPIEGPATWAMGWLMRKQIT